MDPITGMLIIDKPQGITSHGVVSRVRKWCGTRKVGHAGTLDPMATGVLVLGLGRGTKLLTYIVGADKTYTATIRLGSSTPTDDADSAPDVFADPADLAAVTEERIRVGARRLTGDIEQVPSAVSAIKVDGVRSYARVRAGEQVELRARPVTVSAFAVGAIRSGEDAAERGHLDVDVEVTCSSGTYIRALARDLGRDLGVHGHLVALRRTRVGAFDLSGAAELPEDPATAEPPSLMPLAEAAARVLPVVDLDRETATALMQGKFVDLAAAPPAPGGHWAGTAGGELIAVLERRAGRFKSATGIAVPGRADG